MNIDQITAYNGSRDYARLAELAQTTSVICIVEDQGIQDVAHTIFLTGFVDTWRVASLYKDYVNAYNKEAFIQECEQVKLQFIEPPAQAPAP